MVYPDGYIHTHFFSLENGVAVMLAECGYYNERGDRVLLGTGTAYEKENSTFINQTSYIENCETSAVGRALGMAGFGIDVSVASAEEVQNAMLNQAVETAPAPEKASSEQIARIIELITDIPALLKYYKIANVDELTAEQAAKIIQKKERKNNV